MEIGEKLRSLREKKGLTQTEFAKRMKIPNQNVSNYERGFRQPDYDTLKMFADYFEVSTDYLLGRAKETRTVDYRNVGISEEDYLKLSPYHQEVMDFFLTREELFFKEQPEDLKDALEQFEVFYEVWKKHQQQNKSK